MAKVQVNRGFCDEGNVVKLFSISNSALNELLVLARDADTAMSIAYQANHIHYMFPFRKDESYPHSHEVVRPWYAKLTSCWASIQEATARRMEGTVDLNEGYITVGQEAVGK